MAVINKPSQPLIPPTDVEEVEEIAANAAEAAIAADDTHAPLVDDKVPAANLPSYVDDVLNFDSAEEFPEEGEEGKIYVANDTNLTYRWSGVAYIQVGGASLAPGDGIDIENDIVSVDMDYVEENLDHVTEEALENALAEKQDKGDYATNAALEEGLAAKQDVGDYATNSALEAGLATKQPIGDYATNEALEVKADKPVNTIEFRIPDEWDGDFRELFDSQDIEFLEGLISTSYYAGESIAYYDQLGNYYEFLATLSNTAYVNIKPNVLSQGEVFSKTPSLITTVMTIEVDAETGDPRVVIGPCRSSAYAVKPANTVEFMIPYYWSGDVRELLETQDTEFIKKLISNSFSDDELSISEPVAYFDQLGNYYEFLATSENSANVCIKPNSFGQSYDDIPRISPLILTSVSIEMDAETGDSWIVVGEIKHSRYATYPEIESACQEISHKQDLISDLDTIRSGAAAGATAVQPADVADDMEVVTYQTQNPLSAEQLAKAEAGKLAICKYNLVYTKFLQDSHVVSFRALELMSEKGTYTPGYNVRMRRYTLTLDRSTRMLNDAGYQEGVSVADTDVNFLPTGTAPVADGKRIVREANLAETIDEVQSMINAAIGQVLNEEF